MAIGCKRNGFTVLFNPEVGGCMADDETIRDIVEAVPGGRPPRPPTKPETASMVRTRLISGLEIILQ